MPSPSSAADAAAKARGLVLAKVLYFSTAMGNVAWNRFQNVYFLEAGIHPHQIGNLKALGLLLKLVGEPFWCLVADWTDPKIVFLICLLTQIFSMEVLRNVVPLTVSVIVYVKVIRTATAPSTTLTTMATLKLTEGTKEGFGQQRMFGSIAWGFGAWAVGSLIDYFGMKSIFYYTYLFQSVSLLIVYYALPSKNGYGSGVGGNKGVGGIGIDNAVGSLLERVGLMKAGSSSSSSSASGSLNYRGSSGGGDLRDIEGGGSTGNGDRDGPASPTSNGSSGHSHSHSHSHNTAGEGGGAAGGVGAAGAIAGARAAMSHINDTLTLLLDYCRLFCSCAVQCITAMRLVRVKLRASAGDIRQFLTKKACNFILLNAFSFGLMMQVMETYLFLSLKESMHQTQAFGGQCSCVASVSCAIFFYFSDRLIKTYGHGKCLLVAQVIFTFRLCALSLISYDWHLSKRLILGMHVFHGPSFALFWATSVDALFKQCPKSLEMTCMSTLNMFYFVLGPCIGSFVWGYVYEYFGGMTFGFYFLALVAQGYIVRFCWQRSRFLDQALDDSKHDEDSSSSLLAGSFDPTSDGGEYSSGGGGGGGGGEGISLTLSPGHSNGMGSGIGGGHSGSGLDRYDSGRDSGREGEGGGAGGGDGGGTGGLKSL